MNKEKILQGYKDIDLKDSKASYKREMAFLDGQKIGLVPKDAQFSDENYYEYIGKNVDGLANPVEAVENKNSFLVNVFNRLAFIDYKLMIGDRDDLFASTIEKVLSSGDHVDIQYDQIMDTEGYDRTKFVPNAFVGGDKILSQRFSLHSGVEKTNPDKRTIFVVVPELEIQQALLPAITSGLAEGWPTMFFNILQRSWEFWRFERYRQLVAKLGGTPSTTEWFNESNTWTANEPSFVKITKEITDADTFQQFLEQVFDKAATLEAKYDTQYNPAQVKQLNTLSDMTVLMDSSTQSFWRTTNAVLFNGKAINPDQIFKQITWLELLPSEVKKEAAKIKAILYVGKPLLTYPLMNRVRRGTQFWEANQALGIFDHFWSISGVDLSKNVIIFYEEGTEA